MLPYKPHNQIKIPIAISGCLLGQKVRYDGGDKLNRAIAILSEKYFDWRPLCPEMEIGLGAPREKIGLAINNNKLMLVGEKSGTNHSARMDKYATEKLTELADVCGYILKSKSPSCGLNEVSVKGQENSTAGFFAGKVIQSDPLAPIVGEDELSGERGVEAFIECATAYYRWRSIIGEGIAENSLPFFHEAERDRLFEMDQKRAKELDALICGDNSPDSRKTTAQYGSMYMIVYKGVIKRLQ